MGNKAAGALTVAAKWNRDETIHGALNRYVRKGNPRSRKSVHVVHRLDQATTGVLIFAKTEEAQVFLKNNWKSNIKTYYTIVHGVPPKKSGTIQSYLEEDENYHVHSHQNSDTGKLAITEYEVLKTADKYSLVKINLLTGKKNQIRVHMAEIGHPIVGDSKYGKSSKNSKNLFLHSYSLEFTHPFKGKRLRITAPVPEYFRQLIEYDY